MAGLRASYSNQAETLQDSVQHLTDAVERDPEFALAHATLSFVAMNIHFGFDPQHTWLEKPKHHFQRALALDSALPEAHLARSWILWSPAKNFQHIEAIAGLEQVLAAQPNSERAHNRMATICQHIGLFREARIACDRAQQSNPKAQSITPDGIYLYSGNFAVAAERAAAKLKKTPVTMYALVGGSAAALYLGDLDLAEQRLALALEKHSEEPLLISMQGMVHARRNQTDLALECVQNCIYGSLGDAKKAMAWIERTANTGFPCWAFFRLDPHLECLREEPEFKQLMAGLEEKYTALKIERP